MKKHIRFTLGVILLVFTFNAVGIATSLVTVSKANAQTAPVGPDIGAIDKQVQAQYFARIAMRALFDNGNRSCLMGRGQIGKTWENKPNKTLDPNDFGLYGPIQTEQGSLGRVGSLYATNGAKVADGEDYTITCSNDDDLKTIATALGYGGYSDLIADLYDCKLAGDACKVIREDGSTVNTPTSTPFNPDVVKWQRARVLKHVKDKKLDGAGGDLKGDFTDPIRYWYYNKIYRNSTCSGIFKNDTTDLPDTNHYKIKPSKPWAWIDDKGIATSYNTMIVRGAELETSIEGLNNYGNQIDGNAWCERIGDMIKPVYATAYQQEFIIPALQKAASADVKDKCNKRGTTNDKIKCYAENGIAPSGTMQGAGDVTDNTVDPCQASGLTLSWVICGGIDALDSAVSWFGDRLTKLLEFKVPSDTASNVSSDGHTLYLSWSSFRSLANLLLIIIFLVIILSQIISIESLSAYTVKKAIPRLVIAAIVVQLSWYVTIWLVGLVQAFGDVAKDLVLAPFNASLKDLTFTSGESFVTFISGGIGFVASGIGLWGAIGTTFLAVLFAVLAAFFVVLVRRLVIIACIVMAPVAFIAWILPNTQPLFKLWWGFLTKTLLMYPLIVMLLASGRVASSLLISGFGSAHAGLTFAGLFQHWDVVPWAQLGKSDPDVFTKLAAIVAYFAPYAMIPLTFKFAGGLISNVGGMVNDRSRGILDNRKKMNAQANAGRRAQNAAGTRFNGKNAVTRRLSGATNRVSGGIGAGAKGAFGFGNRGASSRAGAALISAAAFAETDKAYSAYKMDDKVNRALGAGSAPAARALLARAGVSKSEIDRAVGAATDIGFSRSAQIAGAQQAAKLGFVHDADEANELLTSASGGSASLRKAMQQQFEVDSGAAGRFDLRALGTPDQNGRVATNFQVHDYDEDGNITTTRNYNKEDLRTGFSKADLVTRVRGKEASVRAESEMLTQDLRIANSADDTAGAIAAESGLQGLKNHENYAPPANATHINAALENTDALRNPPEVADPDNPGKTMKLKSILTAQNDQEITVQGAPQVIHRTVADPADPTKTIVQVERTAGEKRLLTNAEVAARRAVGATKFDQNREDDH